MMLQCYFGTKQDLTFGKSGYSSEIVLSGTGYIDRSILNESGDDFYSGYADEIFYQFLPSTGGNKANLSKSDYPTRSGKAPTLSFLFFLDKELFEKLVEMRFKGSTFSLGGHMYFPSDGFLNLKDDSKKFQLVESEQNCINIESFSISPRIEKDAAIDNFHSELAGVRSAIEELRIAVSNIPAPVAASVKCQEINTVANEPEDYAKIGNSHEDNEKIIDRINGTELQILKKIDDISDNFLSQSNFAIKDHSNTYKYIFILLIIADIFTKIFH